MAISDDCFKLFIIIKNKNFRERMRFFTAIALVLAATLTSSNALGGGPYKCTAEEEKAQGCPCTKHCSRLQCYYNCK